MGGEASEADTVHPSCYHVAVRANMQRAGSGGQPMYLEAHMWQLLVDKDHARHNAMLKDCLLPGAS
jgi:hypothetical protein